MPTETNRSNGRILPWRLFETVTSAIQIVVLAVVGYIVTTQINHGERLASIEANRYTSMDAIIAERANTAATVDMLNQIATLRADLAAKADVANVPPPEVVAWLERLERRIEALDAEIERRHSG